MDSKKLAVLCRKLAENKKAENAVILDVRKLSSVTDYFVIVSGGSEPHLRAIANEVTDQIAPGAPSAPAHGGGRRRRHLAGVGLFRRHRAHHAHRCAGRNTTSKACGETLRASASQRRAEKALRLPRRGLDDEGLICGKWVPSSQKLPTES
jgi:hypothetical protein